MESHLTVLALALMPALGNFAGGLLAEIVPATPRLLSGALHLAAGIILAVVAVELMPEALAGAPPWIVLLGLCLGGGFYILLESVIDRLQPRGGGAEGGAEGSMAGAWLIYAAVSFDLFSDGLMIGAGSSVSLELALVLALGQVMADVPEGFATIANFKNGGQPRRRRLMLAAGFVVPCLIGAAGTYVLLRDLSDTMKYAALAFTVGILLLAAIEEMMKEAHESADDTHLSSALFIGGFALFTFVATFFDR
ncbi:peptidoglycan-binding protein [Ancylobacter sp. MQZ15Z-1]|uniref:Peptidoglycan-binding protein n=1 Tax=Ancylobacter mangrovi TaxID=2972472 RepID=A0A9X2T0L6_9HYPH|nr:peptidoglycan-binding protein [Ancylobacter mangrovi]MCS0494000.1 peptidoglycan-binding protein [Ancylobacter mangrovi]